MVFKKLKSTKLFFILALFTITTGYIYATPYISIISLKNAIERRDIEKANKFINYKKVRKSLEKEVQKEVMTRILEKEESPTISELQLLILKPLIKKVSEVMIESTVNPNGLRVLLYTGDLIDNSGSEEVEMTKLVNKQNISKVQSNDFQKQKISLYYKSPNIFILESKIPENNRKVISLWRRKNIIDWHLTAIRLFYYK
ncbi:DUF2939 domain-containing protein [Prochlorococcus marinus]|uniref:DUF2939 domain-containing protein n=1 Tax=Prochlorococcus marinus (strain MIT 9211) TaxID=93059 RepID=A9BAA0_PROM4|nr:DUF2939 domain-containing protein [Prochlorococcus marinus]ABX08762.1 Hypothetical protein P9211_08311 [Prochlorococcus marinus str. MIT 9211]